MSDVSRAMPTRAPDQRPPLLVSALRRRLALILAIAIVIVAGSAFLASRTHKQYAATSAVLLRPLPGAAFSTDTGANAPITNVAITTESELIQSPQVVAAVNKQLGLSLSSPPKALQSTVPLNTETVQIRFTAGTAAAAQVGANAFAKQFLAYRGAQALGFQDTQVRRLTASVTTALAKLKTATSAAAEAKPPPDAAANVQLYTSIVASLEQTIGQVQSSNLDPGVVVAEAALPTKPTGISSTLIIAVGAALGVGLGLLVAVWSVRRDDRLRTRDMRAPAGIPVLAALVAGPQRLRRPTSSASEVAANEYRRLRASVLSIAPTPATLMVAGVAPDQAPDLVAAGLSQSLADAGYSVCVVDASAGRSATAPLLRHIGAGLSDVLLEWTELDPALRRVGNVAVVPAGTDAGRARDLYAGDRLEAVLTLLTNDFDFVIVAGPSLDSADGLGVGRLCRAVLLVATERSSTIREIAAVRDAAEPAGVRLVGVVSVSHRILRMPEPTAKPTGGTAPVERVDSKSGEPELAASAPKTNPD